MGVAPCIASSFCQDMEERFVEARSDKKVETWFAHQNRVICWRWWYISISISISISIYIYISIMWWYRTCWRYDHRSEAGTVFQLAQSWKFMVLSMAALVGGPFLREAHVWGMGLTMFPGIIISHVLCEVLYYIDWKAIRPPLKPVWILLTLEGPWQQSRAFRSFSDMVNLILSLIPEYLWTLFVGLLTLFLLYVTRYQTTKHE